MNYIYNIFLLGNGFDLHHCFPTKYKSFLNTIRFLVEKYNKETMKTVADVFGNSLLQEADSDIKGSYALYKTDYQKCKLNDEMIALLIKQSKENIWMKLFLDGCNKDILWIDLEKEIERTLAALDSLFATEKKNFFQLPNNKVASYIASHFVDYFCNQRESPAGVYDIKPKYLEEIPLGSGNEIINYSKVVNDIHNELLRFSELLAMYLKLFVEEPLDVIKGNHTFTLHSDYLARCVITFNYTDTFEKLYDQTKGSVISHIHGRLNRIIIGINSDERDELDSLDSLYIRFKKYYNRVRYNTDTYYYNILRLINEKNSLGMNTTLYVIGHSLSVSDADIIKELFERCKSIVICYHDESYVEDSIKSLIELFGKTTFDIYRNEKKLRFEPITTIISKPFPQECR